MSNYAKLVNGLETLGLTGIKSSLDSYIELINSGEKTVVDALCEMVGNELEQNKLRAINSCVKVANFPFMKTLADFDFPFQPSINKQEIMDLATLRFIEKQENILFVGSSGVGKTHLATSIGIECASHRYSTYFVSFQELMNQLASALNENRLDARMKFFAKYKILIIDEIGYIPISVDSANLFFQLIAKRYEKHCTMNRLK